MSSTPVGPIASLVQCGTTEYGTINSPFSPSEHYPELPFVTEEMLSPTLNHIYAGVRRALFGMGLDKEHYGTAAWNPFGTLVRPGQRVVIKPNLVYDTNRAPGGTRDSLVTHLSVIRPLVDYALKAMDFRGRVIICDAPQQDCNLYTLLPHWGIAKFVSFYRDFYDFDVEFTDLRLEAVDFRDGVVVRRAELLGDPEGYTKFDLGEKSAFAGMEEKSPLLRGADYDHQVTIGHHTGGRHEYLISNTVLNADLLINVPKVKVHKKSGVTLALKNLVGINGDKNWLPHFRTGFPEKGGDEFPSPSVKRRIRSWAVERARVWLKSGKHRGSIRMARRFEQAFMRPDEERSGNWYGNDTVWRMVLDLNRCLYYGDVKTGKLSTERAARNTLAVMDGIVAGEGSGPLRPVDKPLGLICAGFDPVALDLAVVKVMGFDWSRIPKIVHAIEAREYRLTEVENPSQVIVSLSSLHDGIGGGSEETMGIDGLKMNAHFVPHSGWKILVPEPVAAAGL